MYQLSEKFGASQLVAICNTYILLNETGEDIKVAHIPGSSSAIPIKNNEMMMLDF